MRLATKDDIDKISIIRVKQQKDDWQEKYEDKYDLLNTTKSYLEKHLNNDFFAFVEEKDNDIIAICCLQIIEYLPQCNDNGRQGYICNVYTEKEYRNKGLGKEIVNSAINYIKELKAKKIYIYSQLHAVGFYEKLGFKVEGDIFYEEDHPHKKVYLDL